MKSGVAVLTELRLKRRDGSDLWVSVRSDSLFDGEGKYESSLALMMDVTGRRQADELRNRLAAIVSSSDDAIISRGVDGLIRTWNRGAERLTQYSADEAVGRPLAMLYPPEQTNRPDGSSREWADTGGSLAHFEVVVVRKDGSRVHVALTSSVLTDEAGGIIGASIIGRDLTERRKAEAALHRSEEQLRQAQKLEALGRLAGGVAHDFNNVLSVILSYSVMLADGLDPGDPRRIDLEEISKAGHRAAALTRQLLMFSRQEVAEPKVLDLNDLLANMDRMLQRILGEDVVLVSARAPAVGRIRADPGHIEQIIMNLVVNARDAMPTGGKLTIETANVFLEETYAREHLGVTPGAYVRLTVTDTGIGMDPATQGRIFEPFFTTKEKGKGTGLGLSTVFGIVQQCRGGIWVDSEPGHGATFKVHFPRVDAKADRVSPSAAPVSVRASETILLVEDEDQIRLVAREILRKQGYRVIEAGNAGEALLHCESYAGTIHLLLTDVVMPQMSGPELAKRLVRIRPTLKVLCMSGYMDDAVVRYGALADGMAYLQKPITPDNLTQKVRAVLDAEISALGVSTA